MRPPVEWTEQDVERMISDQVKESLTLDYKECDALGKADSKKREISKDVSAFANSAGGTIVYGVIERNHLPEKIDAGYDPSEISREWLEQVINSTIQRRIDGIRINQIDLKKTNPGKVIYVVDIPQSLRAPHIASDHRYYKRFNFQSVYMEEYEVRDVSRRLEAPDLRLEVAFVHGPQVQVPWFPDQTDYSAAIPLRLLLANDSPQPAEVIRVNLLIDARIKIAQRADLLAEGRQDVELEGWTLSVKLLGRNHRYPERMPVWQGQPFPLAEPPVEIAVPVTPHDDFYLLGWRIASPRMPAKHKWYVLSVKDHKAEIAETSLAEYIMLRGTASPQ
jgi:Schlafen, AlbA_2